MDAILYRGEVMRRPVDDRRIVEKPALNTILSTGPWRTVVHVHIDGALSCHADTSCVVEKRQRARHKVLPVVVVHIDVLSSA